MPPKITPKNLSYDTTLPPFLQKLQNNYDRGVEGRDGRHESALLRGRPKRVRNEADLEEDDPVYVDEEGNVVGKEGLVGEEGEKEDGDEGGGESKNGGEKEKDGEDEESIKKVKENTASFGGAKKRRIGKVVGGEMDSMLSITTSTSTISNNPTTKAKPLSKSKNKRPSKKPPLPKMSFGDEEDG